MVQAQAAYHSSRSNNGGKLKIARDFLVEVLAFKWQQCYGPLLAEFV